METNQDLNYRAFTGKAEYDKAINSLKGILHGIRLDDEINFKELQELDRWAEIHSELVHQNPFYEFIQTIRTSIRDEEIPVREAIEDLYWLTQKYDKENVFYDTVSSDLQILQGICHGILADGIIKDKEVTELQKWLDNNLHLSSYYPYDELRTVLSKILADGIVDEEEKILLKAYFNQFVQLTDKELTTKIKDEVKATKISGLCALDPEISFENNLFCITGKLQRETRKVLSEKIVELGGTFKNGITKSTNYLVVGDNGNPAWAFACYGRKVEEALKMRRDGANITIVHELDLWDYIDEMNS
ncbi:BRCT domain-containing protein [Mesonia mobilis]|uniref:BRCT domain-containing protein n=1 Tax=Mesonia mobilis TaxID=369791 RepID=UPI0024BA9C8D|nr:BRCT domain-containing protein [Mesonia mobilis]